MDSKSDLIGVGGWLKFLCFSLVCITPVVVLYGDARAHAVLASRWYRLQPRFQMVFGILVLLDCYRVTLSILSGIALWRRERYAVRLTELYLLSIPLVHFIAQQLMSPWRLSHAYDPEWVFVHVAGPLLWVVYLECSRRVRNTFRPPVPQSIANNQDMVNGPAVITATVTAASTSGDPGESRHLE